MTRPITFQEAQQAVAEKRGYNSPEWATADLSWDGISDFYREVSELMAESWANYYVKVKIEEIRKLAEPYYEGEVIWPDDITELIKLPFPEER